MIFTGWNLKCSGNRPNIILGKYEFLDRLESPLNAQCWISRPLGCFKVLFSLSEQIYQVITMWGSWWNVKERVKNVYESESFKIRLPNLIKRNATCHSFEINFFLSFIFYLFNNTYLVTDAVLWIEGLKINKTWHLLQVPHILGRRVIETS